MLSLTDTHCHIQEAWKSVNGIDPTAQLWDKAGRPDPGDIIARAQADGVAKMICVGTTLPDSKLAVDFIQGRSMCRASIGLHPHEAKDYADNPAKLAEFAALAGKPGVIAVGECGLDYFYNHSPKADQAKILRFQIELALDNNLPMIFHVREAFDDFWPIFDEYKDIRGVIHSFSAGTAELEQILSRGLYVGLNGIMTFTKHVKQLDAARAVPQGSLLLETDAPYLTPQPFRASICEPRHVRVTAEFLAELRGESLQTLASVTTQNAHRLFGW
ncbi:MAG TPA: TatD family hydrolase [Candidatus Saccharimonadales bacterium]|jgi:TatD DNase family protein|nr:TatD family hydrolase [Candidatus Saccharimonadales bacterium]